MHITIVIPSNRPVLLSRFLSTVHLLNTVRSQISIHISAQHPWTPGMLNELLQSNLIHSYSLFAPSNPTKMIMWRTAGMIENKNADYYWFLDDDHQFADSSKSGLFQKTCEEYYSDVVNYLFANPDVGVLCCNGYFGGYAWGYDFKKNPKNGLLSTDKGGMFIKNIGIDLISPPRIRENFGALFESVFGYNVMIQGYNFARRFNCPTKAIPPGSEKHIGKSNLSTYSDLIVNQNNQKYVRDKFNDPNWNHSSKLYPKDIAKKLNIKQ